MRPVTLPPASLTETGLRCGSRHTALSLRTVASRMLGSSSEAGDAVQEAWLRLKRSSAHSSPPHAAASVKRRESGRGGGREAAWKRRGSASASTAERQRLSGVPLAAPRGRQSCAAAHSANVCHVTCG
jgi:Sigma-70 region 2